MSFRQRSVASFVLLFASASGLAQSAAYLNPELSPQERAHDLVSRMTLEEKTAQLEDYATAIPRLGIPDYQTWNESTVSRALAMPPSSPRRSPWRPHGILP